MTEQRDPHAGLHSEQGALAGEHPGRAANPMIKVHDLAWLEFEKPDLARAELFAHAFGFATVRAPRTSCSCAGTDAGAPCVLVRRGPRSTVRRPGVPGRRPADVLRLADATGATVAKLPESLGGVTVDLTRPERGAGAGGRRHPRAARAAARSRRRPATSVTR